MSELGGQLTSNLGDLAFSLPGLYAPELKRESARTLLVSIHLEEYADAVLEMLGAIDRLGLVDEVLFISLDEESVAITGDIARLFKPEQVRVSRYRYDGSITEVIDLLANASCVVTSKLHGAITSYVYNVPALLFCYQRKCVEFLNDRGLPGPREPLPSATACVATVTNMLTGQCEMPRFTSAADHIEAFGRFLDALKSGSVGDGERVGTVFR
ncbi:polysaccharide pyruvyl transferase family protein [Paraburkholderia sp. J69-1]|uniref:polysaccharide pyruvyl transferase family protein n=1 Tax=unclassified Paraburkholderia TaxID=2615204 RepID=UPI0039F00F1C